MATSPLFFISGTTGLVDVGYRFFDVDGNWVGSRITTGVFEQDALNGTYGVAAADIPPTSRGVHWNSAGTPAIWGDEIFPATGYATDVDALLAAGNGPFPITITVTDGSDPLQNVTVSLFDNDVMAGRLTTDASGNATFSLSAGTYEVVPVKPGYSSPSLSRTVTGAQTGTLTDDIEMTGTTPTPPVDPTLCLLYGTLLLPSGEPAANVKVSATLVGNRALGSSGSIVTYSPIEETTNSVGYFEITLIRTDDIDPTPSYTIVCREADLRIPNVALTTASVDVETLLP